MSAFKNAFDLACPSCGSQTKIDVVAENWVRLTRDGTDAEASGDGGHDWDDTSAARCERCGWTGTAGELKDRSAA